MVQGWLHSGRSSVLEEPGLDWRIRNPCSLLPSTICRTFSLHGGGGNKECKVLIANGGSFLGVLSKAFCALQSHLKFLQLFSGGGGSLYLLFGATG